MNVKQIRTKLGLTGTELSELLGLSGKSRIAEYENGTREPSLSMKVVLYLLDKRIITTVQLKNIIRAVR